MAKRITIYSILYVTLYLWVLNKYTHFCNDTILAHKCGVAYFSSFELTVFNLLYKNAVFESSILNILSIELLKEVFIMSHFLFTFKCVATQDLVYMLTQQHKNNLMDKMTDCIKKLIHLLVFIQCFASIYFLTETIIQSCKLAQIIHR